MDVDDDDNRKMPATQDWKIVGAKQPKPNTPKTATTTPLPKFPPRPAPTKPGANTQTPPPNDTTTFASTSTRTEQGDKSDSLFTHVNDGTLRITTKWKPTNYDKILEDQDKWNLLATDLIQYLHVPKFS